MDSSKGSDSSFFSLTNEGAGFSEQIRLEKEGRTQVYYKVCIDGRYYFMKALRPEYLHKEFYREMMRKEYELGSQLNSDYVVHYTRLAESPDECYLLMEYINGKNLAEFLKDNPLYFRREAHLNRFLRQLCLALQEMHQHQALHLDLKPSNILLTATNSDVRLIDLGCSYIDSRALTIGHTDRYAAPEQLGDGSDVDARTDIYAIGRVLQFIGEDHLPRRYRKIVHRCLQEDKEKRFQTVEEVLAEITPPTRQSWLLLPVMLLLVLAGLYAGGMFRADGEFLPQDSIIIDRSTGDTLYMRVLSVEERRAAIVQAPPGGHVYTGDIVIPESIRYKRHTFRITEIGEKAFAECTDIKSMHLPSTLGIIHEGAFYGCTDMKTINLPSSLRTVMPDAFVNCISLTSVRWPETISEVTRNSFVACRSLREVILPEGITAIRQDAFCDCDALTTINLPSTLTHLDRGVFYSCDALRSITIPEHVTFLGPYLFYKCSSLETINMQPLTPPVTSNITDHPFIVKVYVPGAAYKAYCKAPGWKDLILNPDRSIAL